MVFNPVYITRTSNFFPNDPVANDEMEEYLGLINDKPSKARKIVLRNNGIKRRFYALKKGGKPTHTNAEMTAIAVRKLFSDDPGGLQKVEMLSCGTSTPDQMMPSHGVMVHGWLPESGAIEVVSPSGVCCASMHAFKFAFLAVMTGDVETAVSTGSERFSRLLCSENFEDEVKSLVQLEQNPFISFEKDFLRWMLSDGAGAFLLSNKKNEAGISLRVEWIDGASYAHEKDSCMYMGSDKLEDGSFKSFMDFTPEEIMARSVFSVKQDVKLLSENIVMLGGAKLKQIVAKRQFDINTIDYFLPHISSEFFRSKINDQLVADGLSIPAEKWFVTLSNIGNVGAGSIYLMLDELFNSGRLQPGQQLLMMVPESSRFSYVYALLTVV